MATSSILKEFVVKNIGMFNEIVERFNALVDRERLTLPKKELCIDTIKQLDRMNNVILHSDRGSQYTSTAFRNELKRLGIIQSLSGTGHCYDNCRMKSFFATLKKEKLYQIPTYRMSREEVKTIVFRYIFTYYNRIRIYTSNSNGLPPEKYRAAYNSSIEAIETGQADKIKFWVFLTAHILTIPEVDIAFRIIEESYETHMRNHNFIEDIRGYDN